MFRWGEEKAEKNKAKRSQAGAFQGRGLLEKSKAFGGVVGHERIGGIAIVRWISGVDVLRGREVERAGRGILLEVVVGAHGNTYASGLDGGGQEDRLACHEVAFQRAGGPGEVSTARE